MDDRAVDDKAVDNKTVDNKTVDDAIVIGYLVPEFPGQTHIMSWRELAELAQMGVAADVVSTRAPVAGLAAHSWSDDARSQTTYLFPPGWSGSPRPWSLSCAPVPPVGGP